MIDRCASRRGCLPDAEPCLNVLLPVPLFVRSEKCPTASLTFNEAVTVVLEPLPKPDDGGATPINPASKVRVGDLQECFRLLVTEGWLQQADEEGDDGSVVTKLHPGVRAMAELEEYIRSRPDNTMCPICKMPLVGVRWVLVVVGGCSSICETGDVFVCARV